MIEAILGDISLLAEQLKPGSLSENSIFVGFLGAALAGSAGWYGRVFIKALYMWLRRKLFDEVTLYSDDELLYYFEEYLNQHKDLSKRRNVMAVIRTANDSEEVFAPSIGSFLSVRKGKKDNGRVKYIFGQGNHFLLVGKSLCWMNKTIEHDKVGNIRTIITLRIFGKSGKNILEQCIQEQIDKEEGSHLLKVYSWSRHGFYAPSTILKRDPFKTLVMPNKIVETMVEDVKDFTGKKDWYVERGIPYRRGYLLYGPPGTGKTSLIKSVASQFTNKVFLLNLSVVEDDSSLDSFFSEIQNYCPSRLGMAFVVIEDIDCVLRDQNREGEAKTAENGVSLNGLLNALDGIGSAENMLVFMTTNYVDALDPALLRPGRADVKLLVDKMGPTEIVTYLSKFFGVSVYDLEVPKGLELSGADLQGMCLENKTLDKTLEVLNKI